MTLYKAIAAHLQIAWRDSMYVQFRAEIFNLLDHTNFGPPNTDRSASALGTTRTILPPRQVQLALKFVF